MLKVAKKIKHIKDPLDLFAAFMNAECKPVLRFEPTLDKVNIARALSSREINFGAVRRLNEYYRLCLAWKKNGDEILENIADQVADSSACCKLTNCVHF
jgi:hypothetical protein